MCVFEFMCVWLLSVFVALFVYINVFECVNVCLSVWSVSVCVNVCLCVCVFMKVCDVRVSMCVSTYLNHFIYLKIKKITRTFASLFACFEFVSTSVFVFKRALSRFTALFFFRLSDPNRVQEKSAHLL